MSNQINAIGAQGIGDKGQFPGGFDISKLGQQQGAPMGVNAGNMLQAQANKPTDNPLVQAAEDAFNASQDYMESMNEDGGDDGKVGAKTGGGELNGAKGELGALKSQAQGIKDIENQLNAAKGQGAKETNELKKQMAAKQKDLADNVKKFLENLNKAKQNPANSNKAQSPQQKGGNDKAKDAEDKAKKASDDADKKAKEEKENAETLETQTTQEEAKADAGGGKGEQRMADCPEAGTATGSSC